MAKRHHWKKEDEYGETFYSKYKKKFVDELKALVPENERKWNGKGWWVSDGWLKEAKKLAWIHYSSDE